METRKHFLRLKLILVRCTAISFFFLIFPHIFFAGSYDPVTDDKTGPVKQYTAEPVTGVFNVREFGAIGDGETLDMQAINNIIRVCSEAGGGTVFFPAGTYLTGTIQLRSNVTLYLTAGATILGSKNIDLYPDVPDLLHPREADKWGTGLLVGKELRNIAITGHGTIDGNKVTNPRGEENYRGPHGILLSSCEKILIQDIFIRDVGNYAHYLEDCSNGNVRGVTVTGGSDGVNLSDCKDFIITGCHFRTGDDCVAGGGWENVVVTNSTLNTSCNGVKNGPRSNGMKNVVLSNLVIKGPGIHPHIISSRHDLLAGIIIFQSGIVDNLVISDISISNARCPFWLGGLARESSSIRNVSISNMIATSVGMPDTLASIIVGTKENPFENISLSNIIIISKGGGLKDLVDRPVPSHLRRPYISLPCYGLYCRNVKDLNLHNVRFSYNMEDARPALICESIERLKLDRVRGLPGTASDTPIHVKDINTLISPNSQVKLK